MGRRERRRQGHCSLSEQGPWGKQVSRWGSSGRKADAHTELGVGLSQVRLADDAISVLVNAAEGL